MSGRAVMARRSLDAAGRSALTKQRGRRRTVAVAGLPTSRNGVWARRMPEQDIAVDRRVVGRHGPTGREHNDYHAHGVGRS